jgi:hypothetical protein
MKNSGNKQRHNNNSQLEFFPLDQMSAFPYGQFVIVTDYFGADHNCYCIDAAVAELISSLPKRKSSLKWYVDHSREDSTNNQNG